MLMVFPIPTPQNLTDALKVTLAGGGLDTACDPQFAPGIVPALAAGAIGLPDLQRAGRNVLTQAFSLGLLDPPARVPYTTYGPERVDTPAARALAFQAAVQAVVLLQNGPPAAPTLPLSRSALAGKTVAVVGPNGNVTEGLLSNYHGPSAFSHNQSIVAGLGRAGGAAGFAVAWAPGCADIACADASGFPAAVAAARRAAVTVAVVGLCSQTCISASDTEVQEEEMHDRTTLRLPAGQEALVRAVAATGTPVVLVLIHGGPLDVSNLTGLVAAVVSGHYPGEAGGDALAAVLLGDASPAGRLTTTWYPEAYLAARAPTDMVLAPHTDPGTGAVVPGSTYLYYDGPALWEFG
jgi:beta-D-xylosidase 4